MTGRIPKQPHVLIIFAASFTGGPGRGLLQLIKHAPSFSFDYTLCNFNAVYVDGGNNRFYEAAKASGIHVNLVDQYFPIDPTLLLRVLKTHHLYQNNIVQTHGYKPNIIGLFLKTFRKIPWIGFAHGYTDDNRRIKLYNRIDAFVLRFADAVITVSSSMKVLLIQKGICPDKIHVIRNAMDRAELRPMQSVETIKSELGITTGQDIIGVIGRLGPEKGQIVFLESFSQILKHHANVIALIVGDGQDKDRLVEYCREKHMAENVRFVGHVDNISDYYQIMDMLVIPSYSEGLPNVLLEAMAFEIPVVATAVGGIPEVINSNNGILVPPGDATRMAREVLRLLKDKQLSKQIQRNICEFLDSSFYQPELRAQKIAEIYRQVLSVL